MLVENNNLPNNPQIITENLKPFKKFCMTIGVLPSSYLESLTYQELLLWFCDYLQNTVIPTVNNNAEAVEELQNLYIELKNYVDNYFTNLDVQDEINNKLDDMAESGELQEIITLYMNLNSVLGFNTISDMKNATNLHNGSFAKTFGYQSLNDNNGGFYKIRNKTDDDIIDDISIIQLSSNNNLVAVLIKNNHIVNYNTVSDMKNDSTIIENMIVKTNGYNSLNDSGGSFYKIIKNDNSITVDEGLYISLNNNLLAQLIVENEINPIQFGCYGDNTHDDTQNLQKAINTNLPLNGLNKSYLISNSLHLLSYSNLYNFKLYGNTNINGFTGDTLNNVTLKNCYFYNFNSAINLSCYWSLFNNIQFTNCKTCFDMINGTAQSTLVENKYMNCNCYNCGTFINVPEGNKLTDGFIRNVNFQANDNTKNAINILSGAGYNINNVHIYGNPQAGIRINNGYNLNISNIYIENYKTSAISITTQNSVNLSNIIINCVKDTNVIILDKNSITYNNDKLFNINNISFNNANGGNPSCIFHSDTSPLTQINNISYNHSYNLNDFYVNENLIVNEYPVTNNHSFFYVDNNKLLLEKQIQVNGSNTSLEIPLYIYPYSQYLITLKYAYSQYLNGNTLSYKETHILISYYDNTNIKILKDNTDIPCEVSYNKDTQKLSINLTPNSTDYGRLSVSY